MADTLAERQFDWADQRTFAALTGDVNPMHVEPAFARRTQAGAPVVHGMHVLLWALDELSQRNLLSEQSSVDCKFLKFVLVGQRVTLDLRQNTDDTKKLSLTVEGQPVAAVTVRAASRSAPPEPPSFLNVPAVDLSAGPLDRSVTDFGEEVGWIAPAESGSSIRIEALFPALANVASPETVMSIALMSTLIGMVAPGLHSIFTECAFQMRGHRSEREGLGFKIDGVDQRFHVLNATVAGPGLIGTVAAFVRGRPVEPPSFAAAAKLVGSDAFAGQRALVIGGSRGIGAASALLLAAGGADVTVTYQRGKAEAEQVTGDIARHGGAAHSMALDVLDPSTEWAPGLDGITHLYFFATPKIFRQGTAVFSDTAFDEFAAVYLKGFARVLTAVYRPGTQLSVLYPSSIAVESRPKGMTEYAMVKAAGEELCKDFHRQWPKIRFHMPRLPRINTDQTATVPPVPAVDAMDVMVPLLREMAGLSVA